MQSTIRRWWPHIAITLLLCLPVSTRAEVYNQLNIIPERGQVVPDLNLPDLKGDIMSLYDHQNQVVLLTFFATWCPQCNSELPKLSRIQAQYQQQDFTVLAVSIDHDPNAQIQQWVEQKGLNYPVLHDPNFSVRESHLVKMIPTVYVLDKKMKLAAKVVGAIDWQSAPATKLIDDLLLD